MCMCQELKALIAELWASNDHFCVDDNDNDNYIQTIILGWQLGSCRFFFTL